MDEALLRAVVQAQLGRHRSWEFYDRRQPTYLNLVLAHAERRSGRPVNLVWVEGGFLELFTLQGAGAAGQIGQYRPVAIIEAGFPAARRGHKPADRGAPVSQRPAFAAGRRNRLGRVGANPVAPTRPSAMCLPESELSSLCRA